MSPCSAACTVPRICALRDPGRLERRRAGSCTSTRASRARAPAGRARTTSITPLRRDLLALVRDDLVRAPRPRRGAPIAAPSGANCVLVDDRDVGLGARLGVLVGVVVLARAARRGRRVSSSSTRYCRPWCRYTAPGCATENTRASSTVPIVRSLVVGRSRRYSIDDPLRSPTSRAGGARPPSTSCPPRGFSRSACTSSRTASSSPAPNQRSSSGVERQLVRRARDLRRAARTGSGGSRPRARAGGASARRGARRTTGRAGRRRRRARPPTAGRCARPVRPAATSTRACRGSR